MKLGSHVQHSALINRSGLKPLVPARHLSKTSLAGSPSHLVLSTPKLDKLYATNKVSLQVAGRHKHQRQDGLCCTATSEGSSTSSAPAQQQDYASGRVDVATSSQTATGMASLEQMSETQRYVLADEWGYDMLGTMLPSGARPEAIASLITEEVMEVDPWRALRGMVAPLLLMAAGYFWLWYMHTILPIWQLAACWGLIGTGYFGLFNLAHECAKGSLFPQFPKTQVGLA